MMVVLIGIRYLQMRCNADCVNDGKMDMTRQAKDGLGPLGTM